MLRQLPSSRWDYQAAAHLLNRAGFGGPPAEIEKFERWGLEKTVSYLVDYEQVPDATPDPDWAKPDPDRAEHLRNLREAGEEERRQLQRQTQQADRQRLMELRHWWLQRVQWQQGRRQWRIQVCSREGSRWLPVW